MNAALWFLGGLALVAAISYGAAYLFRLKSKNEEPLNPEHLPKDWESVMPKEKRAKPVPKDTGPSFMKVGVKSSAGGGKFGKTKFRL